MRLSTCAAFCGPSAFSSIAFAYSMPPSVIESAAMTLSAHSASTDSAVSGATCSVRAISNEIASTSSWLSFCVILAADSAPRAMQRMATFCRPLSSSWCRDLARAVLTLLPHPGAHQLGCHVGLFLHRGDHALARGALDRHDRAVVEHRVETLGGHA